MSRKKYTLPSIHQLPISHINPHVFLTPALSRSINAHSSCFVNVGHDGFHSIVKRFATLQGCGTQIQILKALQYVI